MKKEYYFTSVDKTTDIHCVVYEPENEKKAILHIVHGMVEYIERYEEFAEYLSSIGFVVVGADMIGHGKSISDGIDLGHIEGKDPSMTLVKNIHKLRVNTEKKYPDLPYFIMGHSMGSYLVRKYIAYYSEGLAGAIIMGTGQQSDIETGMGLMLVSLMSKIKDKHYRSKFIQKLTYSSPYKKFDVYGKDYSKSWLTRDTAEVEKYYNTPECTFLFTLNAYKALFDSVHFDNQDLSFYKVRKDLPLLITSGADDPVGNLSKNVQKVYKRYHEAGITDIQMDLYEDARHEILHELNKEEVFEDIKTWLLDHI